MLAQLKTKYIGDKRLYRRVLLMVVPMILQSMITDFVSLVDNIMVGRVGTEEMSGVAIANQFVYIVTISLFGAVSGPGIFGAQFFGKGDSEGQKQTFRFRLLICTAISALAMIIFSIWDTELLSLFLSGDDAPEKVAETLEFGRKYMRIMLISFIPFGIGQAYSSVLCECGYTKVPLIGAVSAVGINIFLDYVLIFGKFGMPKMGVEGAAIATVISKCIQTIVKVVWTHTHLDMNKYAQGLFKGFYIQPKLCGNIIKRGFPLLMNEFLWVAGMSLIMQCYSVRGLDVIAARNISTTITNLFNEVYIQTGACIAIIVGGKLGANKLEEARDTDNKLLFLSAAAAAGVSIIMLPFAAFFPDIYNTEQNIKDIAGFMILIQALAMPIWAYVNACYFTLRSGGKTGITFMFDFGFVWLFMLPLAFILSRFTSLSIYFLFPIVTFSEIIKAVIGYFLVRSNLWINNIVNKI